jgi:drug/metabolite transporter (DMT)-like permease
VTASPSGTAGRIDLVPAIAFRIVAVAMFATMSLFVRLASETLPVGQIVFWRNALALLPIALYLAVLGRFPGALATRRPVGHLVRAGLGFVSMVAYFMCVARLPLALATALIFLTPVLSVVAGVLVLKERPRVLTVVAVLTGFGGTALVMWPAMDGPSLDVVVATGVVAGVVSALFAALVRVHIRDLTATEHPAAIAFYFAIIAAILTLPTLALGWAPVSSTAIMWLAGAGIAGGLAQVLMCESLARAPVSTLAPLDYVGLVLAFGFDLLVFGIVPPGVALAGAVIIVGASALVALPSGRRRRPKT